MTGRLKRKTKIKIGSKLNFLSLRIFCPTFQAKSLSAVNRIQPAATIKYCTLYIVYTVYVHSSVAQIYGGWIKNKNNCWPVGARYGRESGGHGRKAVGQIEA